MVQEPIPDQEQNPFVGDSQEGIEYVSRYYSKILIFSIRSHRFEAKYLFLTQRKD